MAAAWFICGYKRRIRGPGLVIRYCHMDDYTAGIQADGGDWAECEGLGGYAVVKVRASEETLATINAVEGFYRVPVERLDDTLSSLSQTVLLDLRDRVLAMGFTQEEITQALGSNWKTIKLRRVLKFIVSRRRKARYDPVADAIMLDGEIVSTGPDLDDIDAAITG